MTTTAMATVAMPDIDIATELLACRRSPMYFINRYVKILNVNGDGWIPFELWKAQVKVLQAMDVDRSQLVILKSRQLGMTWLALAYALWLMLFRAPAYILLFSMRDNEAVDLLSRLSAMYKHLPAWLQADDVLTDAGHEFALSNESRAQAFPTSAGDSYTANLVIIDEADLVLDLNKTLSRVKPTINAGGKLWLIGRVDKDRPFSPFKQVFRDSQADPDSSWNGIFLPWNARPDRDRAWYEAVKKEILKRTGSLDELYEQYPETIAQALAPRSLDKRLVPEWLQGSLVDANAMQPKDAPELPGLTIYCEPEQRMRYAIGVDPAEGNPNSDDSAISVMSARGEEVATLAGKIEPSLTAVYARDLSVYYNHAPLMVERNNHGHAVIQWLRENGGVKLLQGHDRPVSMTTQRYGWLTNAKGKALMYSIFSDGLKEGQITIHDWRTYEQLSSIDGRTLSAPPGQMDDRATACVLAYLGTQAPGGPIPEIEVQFRRA